MIIMVVGINLSSYSVNPTRLYYHTQLTYAAICGYTIPYSSYKTFEGQTFHGFCGFPLNRQCFLANFKVLWHY